MATALRSSSSGFAGATFEVDRLEVDEGILTIQGTWSGVRGMRFVRPTLVVEGRQVLATLEHKPWAPSEDVPWIASFPWTSDATALAAASLEVAPSVIVPLGPFADTGRQAKRTTDRSRARAGVERAARAAAGGAEPGAVAEAGTRAEAAAGPEASTAAGDHRDNELRALRRDMLALQSRVDDAARAQRTAESDRDRALAMRDEAQRDLEAALRTRDRMDGSRDEALATVTETELQRDEAIAAVERQRDKAVAAAQRDRDKAVTAAQRDRDKRVAVAEKARAEAISAREAISAERDELRAQREELRAQREEILLAHRTLEQQLHSVRAGRDPQAAPTQAPTDETALLAGAVPTRATTAPGRASAPRSAPQRAHERESDPDEPIGIRSIPAARTAAADLLGPRYGGRADLSTFDLWTMRVLGMAAAICFVLLLLMLLRVSI